MSTVVALKCACDKCLCVVETGKSIEKDGKYYCSEACATGHKTQTECGHKGCKCG